MCGGRNGARDRRRLTTRLFGCSAVGRGRSRLLPHPARRGNVRHQHRRRHGHPLRMERAHPASSAVAPERAPRSVVPIASGVLRSRVIPEDKARGHAFKSARRGTAAARRAASSSNEPPSPPGPGPGPRPERNFLVKAPDVDFFAQLPVGSAQPRRTQSFKPSAANYGTGFWGVVGKAHNTPNAKQHTARDLRRWLY